MIIISYQNKKCDILRYDNINDNLVCKNQYALKFK